MTQVPVPARRVEGISMLWSWTVCGCVRLRCSEELIACCGEWKKFKNDTKIKFIEIFLSQSNDQILLFWVLPSTVETENSLCTISLFWEITWCLFFFPLSSFSWLFTSHALSEWHEPADLGVELRSFMRLHHKAGGGFGGSKFKPKLLGRDAGGACVCPSSHRKYPCLLVCVCVCF